VSQRSNLPVCLRFYPHTLTEKQGLSLYEQTSRHACFCTKEEADASDARAHVFAVSNPFPCPAPSPAALIPNPRAPMAEEGLALALALATGESRRGAHLGSVPFGTNSKTG
jgi:hypothetical protein